MRVRKIRPGPGGISMPKDSIVLYVNAEISTIFIICVEDINRNPIPLLVFELRHETNEQISQKVLELLPEVEAMLAQIYASQERQERIYNMAYAPEVEFDLTAVPHKTC